MNKKSIIPTLLALVAIAGRAQIHYRLEGTIGDSTLNTRLLLNQGMSAMKLVNAAIDTLEVVGGKLIPTEGTLEEPTPALRASSGTAAPQPLPSASPDTP